MMVRLHKIAHARAGDKGDVSMISVIAYRRDTFRLLLEQLSPERIKAHFTELHLTAVERFEMPALGALNFVLHGALRGGVTRSLALDAHGKTLSSSLLEMEISVDSAPPGIGDPS